MILDCWENWARYVGLHHGFDKVFAFLNQVQISQLPVGRYEIAGDKVYAIAAREAGRSREAALLESHRRYIDIQWVLEGVDEMGWRPLAQCATVKSPYDPDKDIKFFADRPDVWIPVTAGTFVIFFPDDAHAPLVGDGEIHKIIVKVAV